LFIFIRLDSTYLQIALESRLVDILESISVRKLMFKVRNTSFILCIV